MQVDGSVRASVVDWISLVLVIVGGLNWGLVGLAEFATDDGNWNLVNLILGDYPTVEAIVYLLVGLAAVWLLYFAWELYEGA